MTDVAWRERHLLDVAALDQDDLELVMSRADLMRDPRARGETRDELRGRRVATLFYEPSTRTRLSFELAARALGAEVLTVSVATSSVAKGESLVDTVRTLEALGAHMLVIRHPRSGAATLAAQHFGGSVVNGGDGWHAHPTQALLDLYTLRRHLPGGAVRDAKVAIVGDVLHSRVCRSNVWALTTSGADVWLAGPAMLLRGFEAWARAIAPARRLHVTGDVDEAIRGADAVMALRIQRERLEASARAVSDGYLSRYGLTEGRLALARPHAVVLHPGPVDEGVEIAPDVAAGPRSVIGEQVRNGVAVRMAVLSLLRPAAHAHEPA